MAEISKTFRFGDRVVNRIGYGAMHLAGPRVFGPPKDVCRLRTLTPQVRGLSNISNADRPPDPNTPIYNHVSIKLEFCDSRFVPQHTVASAVGDDRHAVDDLQRLLEKRHRPVHIFQPMPARRCGKQMRADFWEKM
jgi:hypothetical protein